MDLLKLASSNWVIIILIILLVWRILRQNWILILILGFLLWKNMYDREHQQEVGEEFDADMREFVALGERRYDLRGAPMNVFPHPDCRYTRYGDCYNSNL